MTSRKCSHSIAQSQRSASSVCGREVYRAGSLRTVSRAIRHGAALGRASCVRAAIALRRPRDCLSQPPGFGPDLVAVRQLRVRDRQRRGHRRRGVFVAFLGSNRIRKWQDLPGDGCRPARHRECRACLARAPTHRSIFRSRLCFMGPPSTISSDLRASSVERAVIMASSSECMSAL